MSQPQLNRRLTSMDASFLDQHLYFGLTADVQAMPNVEKLRDFLNESFFELRAAAGVEEIKPQVVKAKAAAASKQGRSRKGQQ